MRVVPLLSVVALFGVACSASSDTKVTASVGVDCTLIAFTVSPASVTMFVGDSAQMTAKEPAPPCATGLTPVFWRSSDPAVATVDSAGGKVRARGAGQATILATSLADAAFKGAAAIVVSSR